MVRVAANLHTMFTDLDALDRFDAASAAGFTGVELFLPYDLTVADIRQRLDEFGLSLVQLYLPPGDFASGERGIAIFAERDDEFMLSVRMGVVYALATDCPSLNCLVGIGQPGGRRDGYRASLVHNVRRAARVLATEGLELLLEPISNQGPDYFIRYTREARSVIEEVAEPNLGLMLDLYHTQVLEGNLAATIIDNFDLIRHIQVADVPGRHEPGTGEINYPFLFDLLDERGYAGWIGCEYLPSGRTEDRLGWAQPYLKPTNRVP